MKRPRWRTGVPSDGHTKLIDTEGRAFIVQEVGVHQFELVPLPDPPPATMRRSTSVTTQPRRVAPRR